jgi:hypothetical protein
MKYSTHFDSLHSIAVDTLLNKTRWGEKKYLLVAGYLTHFMIAHHFRNTRKYKLLSWTKEMGLDDINEDLIFEFINKLGDGEWKLVMKGMFYIEEETSTKKNEKWREMKKALICDLDMLRAFAN